MKQQIDWLLALMAVALIVCSCNKEAKVQHYEKFEEVKKVTGKQNAVCVDLLYPRSLFVCNNTLVVMNEKVDTLFQVFSLPTMDYKYSFGLKGEGPDDFNLPMLNAINRSKNGFTILDANRLKNIEFRQNTFTVNTEKLPFALNYFNGLIKLTDSLYCCYADFEEDKEFMFLKYGSSPQLWGDYPETQERFREKLQRNQAYDKEVAAKPDGTMFVAFYRSIRRFRIYNSDGEILKDIVLDITPGSDKPDVDLSKNYIHTISAYASNDYIYTLNLDMTAEEIGERKSMPNIQVFTWDGIPVKQYHLDCFISSFAIDEERKKIYGTFVDNIRDIYAFDM